MDLTGKWIKGTGSYVVSEVAPISVKGNVVTNGTFESDTNWAKDSGNTISGGKANWDGTQVTDSVMYQGIISGLAGKTMKVSFTVSNYSAGNIDYRFDFSTASYSPKVNSNGRYSFIGKSITYAYFAFRADSSFIGSIDDVVIEYLPEGYPLLDQGDKVLQCTSAGTVAFPSDVAYGTWEFSWNRANSGDIRVGFISDSQNNYSGDNTYSIWARSNHVFYLLEYFSGIMTTGSNYHFNNIWYRIRVTRTLDGEFYVYIKGGSFGADDWTLVVPNIGTNPVTNMANIESRYFVIDANVGDKIANIKITNQVKQ